MFEKIKIIIFLFIIFIDFNFLGNLLTRADSSVGLGKYQ